MIALIDYGAGNLRSVQKALEAVGAEVELTSDPAALAAAAKIVLPGVGAFGDGMRALHAAGLVQPLLDSAERGVPLLGICLGMQLLFESSEELGQHNGLGLLKGHVRRFDTPGLKVPQTGWNALALWIQSNPCQSSPLLDGLKDGDYAYFNHSYYCQPDDRQDVLAWTDYGIQYASMVWRGSLFGAQFHPEKSQAVGLQILKNFVEKCA